MKTIPKILMKGLKHCFESIFFLIAIHACFAANSIAQDTIKLQEIRLYDTLDYTFFYVDNVYNKKYPPPNLFDGDLNTCWVSGSDKSKKNPSILIQIPVKENPVLTLFPGYGKSRLLYTQNARPKKIRLSVYQAYTGSGMVSGIAFLYIAAEFPREKIIHIRHGFGIQSVPIDFSTRKLNQFKKRVRQEYQTGRAFPPIIDSCLILKLEILESIAGTKYDDVCISEIFFNDRFVSCKPKSYPRITKVYKNPYQTALLLDDMEKKGKVVFKDTSKIVQLMQVSPDRRWAIITTMPREKQGRIETIYHLIDLVSKKNVTEQIEKVAGNNVSLGMVFETTDDGTLYLDYFDGKIELNTSRNL